VGIGTSSPGSFNSQGQNLVIGTGSGDAGMSIFSGSGSGNSGNIFFADGTSDPDFIRGGITYKHDDNSLIFRVDDSPTVTLDSSHNMIFDNSGSGVYLGVTSATASNLLDDYEEGTWTPTFTSTGTNPTVTYGTRHASYRKVGSLVTVFLDMTIDSYTGGTGDGNLTGLPFVQSGSARGVLVGKSTTGLVYTKGFQIDIISGTGFFTNDGGSDMVLTNMSTSGFRVIMMGSYTTA
jgi:hypothetical protein